VVKIDAGKERIQVSNTDYKVDLDTEIGIFRIIYTELE
jgi:hypothetical protein